MVTLRTGAEISGVLMGIDNSSANRRWIVVRSRPIRRRREIVGVSTSFIDVTERQEALDAAKESEAQFRLLAENASEVVCRISRANRIDWISPSAEFQLGVDPAMIVGSSPLELVSPKDQERAILVFEDAINSERVGPIEFLLTRPNGEERCYSILGHPIRDDGQTISLVVTMRNVDDEVQNRRASESLSAGIALITNATDETRLLNDMCETIVAKGGYRLAWYARAVDDPEYNVEIIATNSAIRAYLDGVSTFWADAPNGLGPTGQALREGSVVVIEDVLTGEHLHRWLDRAEKFGFRSSISLPVRVDGRLDGVLNVYADEPSSFLERSTSLLTDLATQLGMGLHRIREHEALVQSLNERAFLGLAIDQAIESILVADAQGLIVYANPAAEKSSGYSLEEMLGQNPRIFKSELSDPAIGVSLWTELAEGRSWRGTFMNRRRNGEVYEEDSTVSPFYDALGGLVGYVAVKYDLTVERRLEADLTRDQQNRVEILHLMRRVQPSETLEETVKAFCDAVVEIDGVDLAAVLLFDDDEMAQPIGGSGLALGEFFDHPWFGRIRASGLIRMTSKGSVWIDLENPEEVETRPVMNHMRVIGFRAFTYSPIRRDGQLMGVLALGLKDLDYRDQINARLSDFDGLGSFAGALFGSQVKTFKSREATIKKIRELIDHERFHPVYQPVIEVRSRAIVGYEALTRFEDGVAPDVHFAEAHLVGLQEELDVACAKRAIAAARTLDPGLWLSINLSPSTLIEGHAHDLVSGSARPIAFEITEHVKIDDYDQLRRAVREAGGSDIFVDDAGAGYAGLQHILQLNPDLVKLDISMVHGVDVDIARQALVSGMCHFASQAGIILLAEGVETSAEFETLKTLGVELAQGYYLGKPQPLL
jgi:PAS domain S-box-containing protein